MSELGIEKAREILANADILKLMNREFDRAFEIRLSEAGVKIIIQFRESDSGQEYMTLGDVAALLQMERKALRQMTEARAQQSTTNPLPFIKIGRSLRFRRSEVISWLERQQGNSAILPPVKGKQPKAKK
jgi:predicted DNA-binding transcriptional regulator AlpA